MTFLNKRLLCAGLVSCLAIGGTAGGVAFFARNNRPEVQASQPSDPSESAHPDEEIATDDEEHISVKTVHPKSDPSFRLNVKQPAYVEPYYQAPLLARVAGPVKFVQKDIGDHVVKGEKLVEIDLPDMDAELAQRQQIVDQRKQELGLAEANARREQVAIDVAQSRVKEKQSQVAAAEADRAYRKTMLDRVQVLAKNDAVMLSLVDEETKHFHVAIATKQSAEIAVLTADAAVLEAREKFAAAQADIRLKASIVKVAEEDVKRARATLEFGTIRAPFDGVITQRTVDPGSFVQNAATAHTEPLMRVERSDIVTVYMKVPDVYATYVNTDTEAIVEMSELPGVRMRGKLTRINPSLQTASTDRTMRVEMDLFNGSEEEYQAFTTREQQIGCADLKGGRLPVMPRATKRSGRLRPLLPGMYGSMQLILGSFKNTLLVPSTAIVNHGGQTFIYEMVDGKAVLRHVNVKLDDGKAAKITLLQTVNDLTTEEELTGKEEIVISNQGELREGQPVRYFHVQW